jgi:hypothetical protein
MTPQGRVPPMAAVAASIQTAGEPPFSICIAVDVPTVKPAHLPQDDGVAALSKLTA